MAPWLITRHIGFEPNKLWIKFKVTERPNLICSAIARAAQLDCNRNKILRRMLRDGNISREISDSLHAIIHSITYVSRAPGREGTEGRKGGGIRAIEHRRDKPETPIWSREFERTYGTNVIDQSRMNVGLLFFARVLQLRATNRTIPSPACPERENRFFACDFWLAINEKARRNEQRIRIIYPPVLRQSAGTRRY